MSWYLLVALFYSISSLFYFAYIWTEKQRFSVLGFGFILVGIAIHTVSIITIYTRGEPIAGGFDRSLYLFSWLISTVYVVILKLKPKVYIIGAFVAPLALIMTLPSIILPQGMIAHDPSLKNPWIIIHVTLTLLGEAIFTLAFIAGVLYIIQERRIKSKRTLGMIPKMPSLTSLDSLNHFCLLVGFPVLTVGLSLGLLSAKEIWEADWNWGHKETWSLVTWFLYAVLIHGRVAAGWKGRKAALGAVLGFGVILFTFFVVGYFAPGQHDFLGMY